MNRPIRRVGAAIGVLLLALLINLNFVQVYKADSYRNNPGNRRILLDQYGRERGRILVRDANNDVIVAKSVKTSDRLKYQRTYPQGPEYAPLTGYDSLLYATTGMEQAASSLLSGDDNRLFTTRLSDLLTGRDPRGGDVTLTINAKAQDAAYKAMGKRIGAVVAIEPKTGAILAAVSTPSYDPNLLSSHSVDKIRTNYSKLSRAAGSPLLNRAFDQLYPPGSVFKIVDTAAALAHGRTPASVLAAPTRLRLPGTTTYLNNYAGESCGSNGKVNLDTALTISCNTAFANLALSLGTSTIRSQAALFGINDQSQNVPLSVAASTMGAVPDRAALAQAAIGQRNVRITPLQAAAMVAAVANNGVLMKPYLIDHESAPDLSRAADRAAAAAVHRAHPGTEQPVGDDVGTRGEPRYRSPGAGARGHRRRQDRNRGHGAEDRGGQGPGPGRVVRRVRTGGQPQDRRGRHRRERRGQQQRGDRREGGRADRRRGDQGVPGFGAQVKPGPRPDQQCAEYSRNAEYNRKMKECDD